MPINYQNGKVYKLYSPDNPDFVYVGSTCQPLYKRLNKHKTNWKYWKNTGKYYYNSCDMFENCNRVKIGLIVECPCDNRNQLLRTEGEYILKMNCINKKVAGRTKKEYGKQYSRRPEVKQHKKEYDEQYYKTPVVKEGIKKWSDEYNNKPEVKAHRATKIKCPCGSVVSRGHLQRHNRTKKHKRFMDTNLIK